MDNLVRKHEALVRIIGGYGSLLVAYSGGVDSTLLLKVASDTLGSRVLAVTARSATYPREEMKRAVKVARRLGVRHRLIESEELSDERFSGNGPERCYWCKRELFAKLIVIAAREGLRYVAVAAHADDLHDYRPGERAAKEMGIVTPLREAAFNKDDVRGLSRRLGIPGWRREAMACLASRFPYGERITKEMLARVEKAEALLRRKGFRSVRIRSRADEARIEVDQSQIGRLLKRSLRSEITRALRRIGFLYVAVDLEGYRMGSLNAQLRREGRTGEETRINEVSGRKECRQRRSSVR